MRKTLILSLALLLAPFYWATAAFAAEPENECGQKAHEIIKFAYPSAVEGANGEYSIEQSTITVTESKYIGMDPFATVCRYWRANPEKLLVTVPIIHGDRQSDEVQADLDILVVNSETLDVITRVRLPDFIMQDAIRLSRVFIDTAPYRLVGGRIAFAVRISREGSSRVNPFYQTTMRLYDLDKENLRAISGDIIVEQSSGEWDGNCTGEFSKVENTFGVSPDRRNGAADIVATSRERTRITKERDGLCDDEEKDESMETYRLRFDGQTYNVPKAPKP
ncbi:MAG TPA: hypothetical protein VGC86_03660 [Afipia sp.]